MATWALFFFPKKENPTIRKPSFFFFCRQDDAEFRQKRKFTEPWSAQQGYLSILFGGICTDFVSVGLCTFLLSLQLQQRVLHPVAAEARKEEEEGDERKGRRRGERRKSVVVVG
jgi:hypothetical protein